MMRAATGAAPGRTEDRAAPDAPRIVAARDDDAAAIAALNNRYAPDGLTLPRTAAFVAARLESYRVALDAAGQVVGCVAVDDYAPSLAELVSLAVAPEAQGRGLGLRMIAEAERLARQRGYAELFAVSLADTLFLAAGFRASSIAHYPEKAARYATVSRSELSIGKKFLFVKRLAPRAAPRGAGGSDLPAGEERRRRLRRR
jgi:amino-acid N-acetyltransferase